MIKDVIDQIRELEIIDDPENADFYTRDWVQNRCAKLNKSPEEYLKKLNDCIAITQAVAGVEPDMDWLDTLSDEERALYKEKLSGPVDGLTYGLMKEEGNA